MTTNWILIGVLVVILVAFIFISMSRRKKETEYRADLESKILPGAKVKTYSGLYGTVVSVTDTTDGKIVLIKTGEGSNVSYQSLHINAIFGFDTKQPVRYDTEGNVIMPKDLTADKKEEVKEVAVAPIPAEAKKATAEKKPATKKASTSKKATPAKTEEKAEVAPKKAVAKKTSTAKKPAAKKATSSTAKKPAAAKKPASKKTTAEKK